jgi:hypothetical protein
VAGASPAHFRVRYSPDGGVTWTVLALDTTSAQISVPADLLAGATAPVLEVQASDGVRTGSRTFPLD